MPPWEKYAAQPEGPWKKYGGAPAATEQPVTDPASFARSAIGFPAQLGVQAAEGFLGTPSTAQGPAQQLAREAGAIGLPTALSVIGQGLGGGVGPAAALGAGGGAGLGTALQAGARSLASLRDPSIPTQTGQQVARDVATSAAVNAATAFAVPKIIEKAPRVLDYLATSKIGGGIAKQQWEFFKGNVQKVLDFVGADQATADALANDLRTSVAGASQKLEDLYKAGITKLEQGKAGRFRMNLDDGIGEKIRYIARDDKGYMDPARNAASADAAFFMKNLVMRVNNLKQASPLDVFNLQRDLNGWIRTHLRTDLGDALLKAKDVIRSFIDEVPVLEPIRDMNRAWHDAKTIDAAAKAFTRSDDLLGYVKRIYSNPSETLRKRSLEGVGALVPEVQYGIENIRALGAAQAVSPLVRSMTGTGFETGLGAAFTAIKAPGALAALPFLSPRAYALGYAYGPEAAQLAQSPGVRATAAVGANTLLDFYRGTPSPTR